MTSSNRNPLLTHVGGRFRFDDAGQAPNIQFTIPDYAALPIIIDNRNLSEDKDDVVMGNFRSVRAEP